MVTIVGPAHAAWIASAWCDHRLSMPLLLSASATFGCSSSGIGACWPGAGGRELCVTSRSSSRPACSSSSHGSMSRITAISCQPRRVLRAAYVDMDGTLLGRGASLFHDADGAFTMLGARALEACARADVEVVPYSGRRQSTLLAQRGAPRPALVHLRGGLRDGPGRRGGVAGGARPTTRRANALLLERYAGRLEMYDPWNRGRESSRLYLGRDVDVAEADELLIEEGFGALAAGRQRVDARGGRRWARLPPGARGRPRRRARSRAHMQARGFVAEEVIAVGDSMEDLGAASVVGTFWLVANATPEVHAAARAGGERAGRRGVERRRRLRGGHHRARGAALIVAARGSVTSLRREPANGGWVREGVRMGASFVPFGRPGRGGERSARLAAVCSAVLRRVARNVLEVAERGSSGVWSSPRASTA